MIDIIQCFLLGKVHENDKNIDKLMIFYYPINSPSNWPLSLQGQCSPLVYPLTVLMHSMFIFVHVKF